MKVTSPQVSFWSTWKKSFFDNQFPVSLDHPVWVHALCVCVSSCCHTSISEIVTLASPYGQEKGQGTSLLGGCCSRSQTVTPWATWSDKACQGSSSSLSDLQPFQMRFCIAQALPKGTIVIAAALVQLV